MLKNLFANLKNSEIINIGREVNYIEKLKETDTFVGNYLVTKDDSVITLLSIFKIISNYYLQYVYLENCDDLYYLEKLKKHFNDLLINYKSINLKDIPEDIKLIIQREYKFLSQCDDEKFKNIVDKTIKEIKDYYLDKDIVNMKLGIKAFDLAKYVYAKLYRLRYFNKVSDEELNLIIYFIQKEFLKSGYTAFNENIVIDSQLIPNIIKNNKTICNYHEDKSYMKIPVLFFDLLDKLIIKFGNMNLVELKEALNLDEAFQESLQNEGIITIKMLLKDINKKDLKIAKKL